MTLNEYAERILRPAAVDLFRREYLDGAEGLTDDQVCQLLDLWLEAEFSANKDLNNAPRREPS